MRRQVQTFLWLMLTDLAGWLLVLLVGLLLRQSLLPMVSDLFASDVVWRIEYLLLPALGIGIFAYEGLYTRRRTGWEEFRHLLRGVSLAMILFFALLTLIKQGQEVSRPALVLTWLLAPGVLVGMRLTVKAQLLSRWGFWPRRVLLLGNNRDASQLARQMNMFPEMGYRVAGCLGDAVREDGLERLGGFDDLERVVAAERIDEVVIAMPHHSRHEQFALLTRAEALVSQVSVLPELFDADKLNVEVEKFERYFLLSFRNNLLKRSNRMLKNSFEIIIVLLTLPGWLPLMAGLAIAVRCSSPGPVFFRQLRIGQGGRPFQCLKFRSMVADAERQLDDYFRSNPAARTKWELERKLKDDPRITSVGRFLRRTSLDELPQIINILRGEMSLIGPRPVVSEEMEKYGEYSRYYEAVAPGLSGLWQVSGRNDIDYDQRVMLDTFYVRNWSLWLDFMILLRTLPAVLKKDGAY